MENNTLFTVLFHKAHIQIEKHRLFKIPYFELFPYHKNNVVDFSKYTDISIQGFIYVLDIMENKEFYYKNQYNPELQFFVIPISIIKELMLNNTVVNSLTNVNREEFITYIIKDYIQKEDLTTLDFIIKYYFIDLNKPIISDLNDYFLPIKCSLLEYACSIRSLKIINYLLDKGCKISLNMNSFVVEPQRKKIYNVITLALLTKNKELFNKILNIAKETTEKYLLQICNDAVEKNYLHIAEALEEFNISLTSSFLSREIIMKN